MLRWNDSRATAWLALAALTLVAIAPAAAADEPARKVRVKKIVKDCEGEDCEGERSVRVIFVGDDGEARAIEGDHVWVGEGGHRMILAHGGSGAFLGVATTDLTPELRRHFGVPEDAGVLVSKVVEDSAAAAAGVLVGDILTLVDGETVASQGQLLRAIRSREPGVAVVLELWRDGSVRSVTATLGEQRAGDRHARHLVVHCEDGAGDCGMALSADFDCGGAEECDVEVECRDGDCTCTVNGAATDCDELPGFESPGG